MSARVPSPNSQWLFSEKHRNAAVLFRDQILHL
ncbi:hypothetical protein TELCIR_24236 [Teladorsagia circumcincta]|uniref:Uncharacterized protein n=1 Tax=Teladorsagia circumcincta TaxID=45464 RepID=A0A2G9TA39_TELCI|nr:hypothetical protein TELCIR_24236 [Teladorsagia circumcincta]